MSEGLIPSIEECFSELHDPRVEGRCDHKLIDMVVLTICGVICGADGWVGVETYGKEKEEFLREHLELPNGIPSHHTFRRVFDRLDPLALQKGLVEWLHSISELVGVRHIAIDGKTLRHAPRN